jgi:hypothetical protein
MQQSDIIRENQVFLSIYGLAEHDQDLLWQHTGRHSATDPKIKGSNPDAAWHYKTF